MSNFIISCGSPVDLTQEHMDKRNIKYIPYSFTLGDVEHLDDLGQSVPYEEFYKKMAEGVMTSTSQINYAQFYEYYEGFLKEGHDLIDVVLSSGLTGTYNNAKNAAQDLKEKYPERKIYVVDSLGASSGYGFLMEALADQRDAGKTIDEVYEFAMANRLRVHHWFFSTDLSYYYRGGRISRASAWFGTALKICPLLNMDNLGRLIPRYKIRGKKAVKTAIVKKMLEHADGGANYKQKCFISHSGCYEDALDVKKLVEENFPNIDGDVKVFYIGTIIGSHTGPGTVALYFFGDERVD